MATLTLGVNGPTLDLNVALNIADTDAPRIMAWLMSPNSGYGTVTENIQHSEPDANWTPGDGETEADRPNREWQAWETRPATAEEAATNYARATLGTLLSATVAWEKAAAAEAAANAVPPIEPVVV